MFTQSFECNCTCNVDIVNIGCNKVSFNATISTNVF